MDTQIGTRPQIGALEINHVAIEKAKLLGFDHSSVITDAEKYMNNLETFKCYNFFSQNFPGCIILKEEDFINLNEILATKTTLDSLTDNKYSNRGDAIFDNVKPL